MLAISDIGYNEESLQTREVYASALAYALKLSSIDEAYTSQSLGIVSGCAYAIITRTLLGYFAQTDVGAYFPVELDDIEFIDKRGR